MASTSTEDIKTVYVDETAGSDESGDGTNAQPYKSAAHAIFAQGPSPPLVVMTRKSDTEQYAPIGVSPLKKARKGAEGLEKQRKKALEAEAKAKEQAELLEKSKAITLTENPGLPKAVKVRSIALRCGVEIDILAVKDQWFKGTAWTASSSVRMGTQVAGSKGCQLHCAPRRHWLRPVGPERQACTFPHSDCTWILTICQIEVYDFKVLANEATIEVFGLLQEVPEGATAPGGHEIVVDYWRVIGHAPTGDEAYLTRFNQESNPGVLADLRHLVIRGEVHSAILKLRTLLLSSFRNALDSHGLKEVTPPCIVQTQVEGGATLFGFKYYDQEAYLTQSSQLYLETCLPALGDVYCVQESFRAENSHTRRHLSEFTHLEAELAFLSFDELMTHIESVVRRTSLPLIYSPSYTDRSVTL